MPSATQARTLLRSFAQHFNEARRHPSSPNPMSMKPYPTQYRVMFGKVARSTALFLPGYFILLGWPLFPPILFNGHMYGLGREPWTKV
ncbi:hypothetical protein BU25DRAFT_406238 [Macroventuria anomochaeta]|uniref:Uncharacterized protein n=1 Tax=Macroventuria anomochaeta TaxID=301207 RepID=A0ACB6SG49_9PLEO|nr:uncharacterized protein BU25DRAFT_406238 [Macroventuria anomochaeta]KAF2632953.1 hypothetical protein BU25DRAFT_406238 [Macroventuria anomochaeta]